MKRLFLIIGLSVFSATAASAADIRPAPMYKASPAVVAAYNWTGFYLGVHAGHLSGHTDNDTLLLPNGTTDSWFAGVQGGYRHHFANNFVLGFQVSAPVVSEDTTYTVFGNPNTVEMKYAVQGQVHVGYAFDRLLPYLSAGAGVARVEAFETIAGVQSDIVTNDHTLYSLGFGMKYGLTQNVQIGLSYNHVWTSRETYDCGPTICGIVGAFDLTGDAVTASLDYRF